MRIPVDWNDPIFIWRGSEDFIWSDAYRIVNEVINAGGWPPAKKWEDLERKLPKKLAEEFLELVVKVNGLSKTFKKQKGEKAQITIDHIQRTIREFSDEKVKVKVEIKP